MHTQDGVVAPFISHRQDVGRSRPKEGKISPANLGNFLAHANEAFHPIQKRVGVATLGCDIDMLKAVRAVADDKHDRVFRFS